MKVLTLLCFFLIIGKASAQNAPKEKSWTAAAGITAYSQNSFVKGEHPWEINLRYKMKEHHVLRASVAFMNKDNTTPFDRFDIEQMPKDYIEHAGFALSRENSNKKIHNISLGYDYNYNVWNNLSVMLGIDGTFGTYKTKIERDVYTTYGFADYNRYAGLSSSNNKTSSNVYNIKPILGIRYQYKCLLAEFEMGPNINIIKAKNSSIYDSWNMTIGDMSSKGGQSENNAYTDKYSKTYFYYRLNLYLNF